MPRPDPSRVRSVFGEALERTPGERTEYLDEACLGDEDLRREVERLLKSFESEGGPLEISTVGEFLAPRTVAQTVNEGDVLADRFRIERFIGRGGMGEVYEAADQVLGGSVALKTLRSEFLLRPDFLARFRREIQLARKVTHSNVCRVYEVGRHHAGQSEIVFLTMELLRGETLAQRIGRGCCTPGETRRIAKQMLLGLAALHDANVVHRDVKPANVILLETGGSADAGETRAVITDFGLAHDWVASPAAESITTTGQLLGTSHYMSPEQLTAQKVGPSSDLYSLAIVMYEMLCGRRPFEADSFAEVAALKLTAAPKPPHEAAPVAKEWSSFLLHCMARKPQDRPGSAREMLALLEECVEGAPSPAGNGLQGGAQHAGGGGGNGALHAAGSEATPSGAAALDRSLAAGRPGRAGWLRRWKAVAGSGALLALTCAAAFSVPAFRQPIFDRACEASPGSPLWCTLPADKDVAILPFEIHAAKPEDRALALGAAQYLRTAFARLAPDPAQLCVHVRDDRHADGVHLVIEGVVEANGPDLAIVVTVREAMGLPGGKRRVLRNGRIAIPRGSLRQLQTGGLESLAALMEVSYPERLWTNWRNAATANEDSFKLYLAGLGQLRMDDPEGAAQSFQEATDPDRDFMFAPAQTGLGTAYRLLGNRTGGESWRLRAGQALQRSVALDAQNGFAGAEFESGELRMSQGDYIAAAAHFEKALALSPFDHETRKRLASAYEADEKPAEAVRVLGKGVELTPGCWLAHNAKASFHSRRAEFQEAETSFLKVLRLAPGNAAGYNNLAFDYLKAGRFEEAVDLAAKAVELEPAPLRYSTLGRAYLYKGCAADAIVNLRKAVELSPEMFILWSNLAEGVYTAGGGTQGSPGIDAVEVYGKTVEACSRALRKSPSNALARALLALNTARLGRAGDARREALASVRQDPSNQAVALAAADAMETAQDREAAIAILKDALRGGLSVHEVRSAHGLRELRKSAPFQAMLQSIGVDALADPGGLTAASGTQACPMWSVAGRGHRKKATTPGAGS